MVAALSARTHCSRAQRVSAGLASALLGREPHARQLLLEANGYSDTSHNHNHRCRRALMQHNIIRPKAQDVRVGVDF